MSIEDIYGGREARPYECRGCGRRYELEYYVCPSCESFSVERT